MALARDEVADGDERGAALGRQRRQVGAEVHDLASARRRARWQRAAIPARVRQHDAARAARPARTARAPAARALGDRRARRRRGRRRRPARRAARAARRRRPAPRSGRGRGRTGTRAAAAAARAAASAPPTRPTSRSCAAAAGRGTGRSRRAARRARRAAAGAAARAARARPAAAQRGPRRDRAVQHEHAHVGAGVARGERLAVRPDAEHRVGGARVVLGDDGDAHGHSALHAASVSAASARVTYGRSARKRAASAIAAARG